MIDAPRDTEMASVDRLRADLGDRLYVLDTPSIEEYVPAEVYERAGRVKEEDLAELSRRTGDRRARNSLKKEISDAIAATLVVEDLDSITTIRDVGQRALL
jgi:hypothetical protein